MMSVKDSSIWELLNEYADIRDGLEDTLQSFENLQFEVSSTLGDIQDEIDTLKEHLAVCSARLIRFKRPKYPE